MEHCSLSKLLNESTVSKFTTKNGSKNQYSANKNKRFKTPMLRLDLSDYSDLYNVIKGRINFTGTGAANRGNKKLVFKNNAVFRSCISQINTFVDNTEDFDIVIPMYNLSEYSDNYSMASGSLWSYYRDEVNDDANEKNDVGN